MNYVGFDWASRAHDVTVLDEAGGVLDRWAFPQPPHMDNRLLPPKDPA